jgi:hypothetical protein
VVARVALHSVQEPVDVALGHDALGQGVLDGRRPHGQGDVEGQVPNRVQKPEQGAHGVEGRPLFRGGGDFTGKGMAMAFSRSSFLILVSVPSGSKLPASLSHPAADRRTDSAPTVQYVPHL